MRSESLIRLGDSPQRSNELARAELARQTEEFLARGGEIEVLPGFGDADRRRDLAVRDRISGKVVSRPPREMLDGRVVVRMAAVAAITGRSQTALKKARRHDARFPQPIPGIFPTTWNEADILAWAEDE